MVGDPGVFLDVDVIVDLVVEVDVDVDLDPTVVHALEALSSTTRIAPFFESHGADASTSTATVACLVHVAVNLDDHDHVDVERPAAKREPTPVHANR